MKQLTLDNYVKGTDVVWAGMTTSILVVTAEDGVFTALIGTDYLKQLQESIGKRLKEINREEREVNEAMEA